MTRNRISWEVFFIPDDAGFDECLEQLSKLRYRKIKIKLEILFKVLDKQTRRQEQLLLLFIVIQLLNEPLPQLYMDWRPLSIE